MRWPACISADGAGSFGTPDPRQNRLLNALPADDHDRLAKQPNLVPLDLGEILYEPGVKLRHVYFPTTATVSLLYVMEDGASAETAVCNRHYSIDQQLYR